MTFELVLTILMLAIEKRKSTFIAQVGIGLALFVSRPVGVYITVGSLNTARSLGPYSCSNQYIMRKDSLFFCSRHWKQGCRCQCTVAGAHPQLLYSCFRTRFRYWQNH